jgi:hypothetical protein
VAVRPADAMTRRMIVGAAVAFVVLYLAHRLLLGRAAMGGPAAGLVAELTADRGRLLLAEVCNGLGLLAFLLFR